MSSSRSPRASLAISLDYRSKLYCMTLRYLYVRACYKTLLLLLLLPEQRCRKSATTDFVRQRVQSGTVCHLLLNLRTMWENFSPVLKLTFSARRTHDHVTPATRSDFCRHMERYQTNAIQFKYIMWGRRAA